MSPGSAASGSPEHEGPRKRLRTALACDECRHKKRKCDGVKPICGGCLKRGTSQCIWNEGRNMKTPSHSYVESLLSRIRDLEAQLNESTDRLNHPESNSPSASHARDGLTVVDRDTATVVSRCADSVSDAESISRMRGIVVPCVQTAPDDPIDSALEECSLEVDAMGIVGSPQGGENNPRPRRRSDYFGPTSTISILSTAWRAMGNGKIPSRSSGIELLNEGLSADLTRSFGSYSSSLLETDSYTNVNATVDLIVPPRVEADALVNSYWTFSHSVYPFLHEPSFTRRYHSLWSPSLTNQPSGDPKQTTPRGLYSNISDRLFHCLLNVVFALGCHFNPGTDEKDRERFSLMFFSRAKRLIDFDMLSQGSLVLVQIMLLMSHYLQSTDMSSSCWNMAGLAIRIAQGIGLHHDPESCDQSCCSEQEDQVDKEMRRRVWTGCVLLDRILSWTYGRPLMIHPTMTHNWLVLPSAIDDQFLAQFPAPPGSQPDNMPSVVESYVQSVKLEDIAGQVLTTFYHGASHDGNRKGGPGSEADHTTASATAGGINNHDLQLLFNFESSLIAWHKALPSHLKVQTYRNSNNTLDSSLRRDQVIMFRRQANVLHTRYLHSRILIMLRPVLTALSESVQKPGSSGPADTSMDSAMRQEALAKAADLCMSDAREMIDIIVDNSQSRVDLLPPQWYNVFYIHGSAIMILIGRLLSLTRMHCLDESSFHSSWNKCIAFLHNYEFRNRSAKRCLKILQLMHQKILNYQSGTQRTPPFGTRPEDNLSTTFVDHSMMNCSPQHEGSSWPLQGNGLAYDQVNTAFMGDLSDMAWLSLVPFPETTDPFPL